MIPAFVDYLANTISRAASRHGFVMTGFARLRRLDERAEFFRQWLLDGRHGEMGYMSRSPERRLDPFQIDPRMRSVITLAYPYAPPARPSFRWPDELRGRIAAYALGPDYHDRVTTAARAVAQSLLDVRPGAITRVYVDTGPVFEREWAAKSGLGWFGRNTNLINIKRGSYFFLGEILTDIEFDFEPPPYRDHCGRCRRCLDLCPTGALADGRLMDSRLCISYLTIELRGPIPLPLRTAMGNWIFGCDVCQEVCPWNEDGQAEDELAPSLPELLALDDDGFMKRYGATAIRRTRRRGFLRNVAVALGNSGNPEAIPALCQSLRSDPEPLVRAHAAWALGAIGGAAARDRLAMARCRENDPAVREEIDGALERVAGSPCDGPTIRQDSTVRVGEPG
jgi:epoxyqueuosine reductase